DQYFYCHTTFLEFENGCAVLLTGLYATFCWKSHLQYKLHSNESTSDFYYNLLFAVLASCMSDDDSNTPLPNTVTWNLTKVEGSIAGVTHTFPTGLIQWTFNEDTNTLVVVNNNTDDSLFDFYDSGTYSYS